MGITEFVSKYRRPWLIRSAHVSGFSQVVGFSGLFVDNFNGNEMCIGAWSENSLKRRILKSERELASFGFNKR